MTLNKEQRRIWDKTDWNDVGKRLFGYAKMLHDKNGFGGANAEPSDSVHKAIEKTMDGTRVWNHKEISLVGHLRGVIQSIYSAEAKRRKLDNDTRHLQADLETVSKDHAHSVAQLADLHKALQKIRSVDPDLAAFFLLANRLAMAGCTTDSEISKAMGLSQTAFFRKRQKIEALFNAPEPHPGQATKVERKGG